jgi:hypothetical protein
VITFARHWGVAALLTKVAYVNILGPPTMA